MHYTFLAEDDLFTMRAFCGEAFFVDGTKTQLVFRFRQKSQASEHFILELLKQHPLIRAPQSLGTFPLGSGSILVQTYIDGADLATILPHDAKQPPLPAGYSPQLSLPPTDPTLFQELGVLIAHMHQIQAARFGHYLKEDPNPHRSQAILYTEQEAMHALKVTHHRQQVTSSLYSKLSTWLHDQCHALISPDESACLVHGDLHLQNIRVRNNDHQWQVAGVIDFEHAKAWLAEYDLTLLYWNLSAHYLWEPFCQGYGPIHAERLFLFEMIKLLFILSSHEQDSPYAQWAKALLQLKVEHL